MCEVVGQRLVGVDPAGCGGDASGALVDDGLGDVDDGRGVGEIRDGRHGLGGYRPGKVRLTFGRAVDRA